MLKRENAIGAIDESVKIIAEWLKVLLFFYY